MRRAICCFLCFTSILVTESQASKKKEKLHKGDTIYAFADLSWLKGQNLGVKFLPTDLLTCDNTGCRYILHACEPLFVSSQARDRTFVLPADENTRKLMDPGSFRNMMFTSPMEMSEPGAYVSVSGGWSPEIERRWSLSRDECLAKIKKPAGEPPPEKVVEPAPAEKPHGR